VDPESWDRAKDIVYEALGRPGEEREAFVRQRCEDPAMREEILSLLAHSATWDDCVASQRLTGVSPGSDRAPREALTLELGTKVGPYVIVDQIGRGGMGRVFLGTDPRLQRRVALKCLLDSREGADVRSRIIHEARAAARISNPHVAVVHDVIEDESRAFIVMEYVEGETLAVRIKRGRLSVSQAIVFGRQLVSALAAAHGEGIVHCDLKPGNIQVTSAGLGKVLDFGIASATRLLSNAASAAATTRVSSAQTIPHVQRGTPPYMSPEQILGGRIDERSDIYSLGAVMFEMCTGQRPYRGNDVSQIAGEQAKGLPLADAVDPDVPHALATVIARAMALDANERFQSVLDVGSALEDVERSLNTVPVDRRTQILRWVGRLVISAAALILVLGVIGFITTVQFDFVFGRDGRFARFGGEPWPSYISWGLLAVVPVAVVMMLTAAIVMAVRFVLGLLELIGPVGRFARSVRTRGRRIALAVGLDKSSTLAQALTGLGIATLAMLFWHHADLIRAWSSFFNSSPIERLLPMTDSAPARNVYHIQWSVATLAFAFGLYKVRQLRARERAREGRLAVVMLATVVATMVVMNEVPYRTFQRRDFERVDLDGSRCYITGESGDEFLVLCPAAQPPRNRTIQRDAPQLRRLGIIENVFKGLNPVDTAH